MSFETSFPDEIILEICQYLHPIDILLSFGALNRRLNRTISDFIRHVRLSSIISYENYLSLLHTHLPSIWSSIEALTISNCQVPCLTTLFLDHTERLLPPKLKKLRLHHLNTNEIFNFISRLINDSSVEELTIECSDSDFAAQQELYGFKIAQILFYRHPTLKSIEVRGEMVFHLSHVSFLSLFNADDDPIPLRITDTDYSSALRRLTIPLQTMTSLCLLLIYQPNLEYLNIHIGNAQLISDFNVIPFAPLLHLHEFRFRTDDAAIRLEYLADLLKYFPQLRSLTLDLTTDDRAFFDGDILQTLAQSLDVFHYSIARYSSPSTEEQTLSRFYTPFWLEEKKWFTQCYWHVDKDEYNADYFHFYSVPFSVPDLDIYQCTNENIVSKERFRSFTKVKRLDLSKTSDLSIIPFLRACVNVRTISLNDVYDEEEDYRTDEEEEITDPNEEGEGEFPVAVSNQPSLPLLAYVRYVTLLSFPESNLGFFERLIQATPNLHRFSVYRDDLSEIIRRPHADLCHLLHQRIDQLEVRLDDSWSSISIHRDVPKILLSFPHLNLFTISLHPTQKHPVITTKELLTEILKLPTKLLCIHVQCQSTAYFNQIVKQGGVPLIRTWLAISGYQRHLVHIELTSQSMTVWL